MRSSFAAEGFDFGPLVIATSRRAPGLCPGAPWFRTAGIWLFDDGQVFLTELRFESAFGQFEKQKKNRRRLQPRVQDLK